MAQSQQMQSIVLVKPFKPALRHVHQQLKSDVTYPLSSLNAACPFSKQMGCTA